METNLNVSLTAPEIWKIVGDLSGRFSQDELGRFRAAAADWPYPLSDEETVLAEDGPARTLSARYDWANGARCRRVETAVSATGVRFASLEALADSAPAVAARAKEIIASLPRNGTAEALDAMARETIVLYVPRGVAVPGEILLNVELSEPERIGAMNIWVVLEENAEATVTLNLTSRNAAEGNLFLNAMAVAVAGNARLKVHEVQTFHGNALSLRDKAIRVGKDGAVDWVAVEAGSDRSLSDLTVDLAGDRAEARINGVYFAADAQRFIMRTRQNHYGKNSYSSLLYKGAVQDQSRSVWTGMIYVDPEAGGTDGYQKNDNLVLSPDARVFARPGLEIITDDVKCSHGTTMTEIDPDQVFYLMSRGIAESDARALIVDGFFNSVLDEISCEPVREAIQARMNEKMKR